MMGFFLPQMAETGTTGPQFFLGQLVTMIVPGFSYSEEMLAKETLLVAEAEFENKRAVEANEAVPAENTGENGPDGTAETAETDPSSEAASPDGAGVGRKCFPGRYGVVRDFRTGSGRGERGFHRRLGDLPYAGGKIEGL
jgi:hypothetical protein